MRNSSFKLLCLIAVMLIIAMHILGYVDLLLLSPVNKGVQAGVNSTGNTGVSCFVLISGFFGVILYFQKVVNKLLTCAEDRFPEIGEKTS